MLEQLFRLLTVSPVFMAWIMLCRENSLSSPERFTAW